MIFGFGFVGDSDCSVDRSPVTGGCGSLRRTTVTLRRSCPLVFCPPRPVPPLPGGRPQTRRLSAELQKLNPLSRCGSSLCRKVSDVGSERHGRVSRRQQSSLKLLLCPSWSYGRDVSSLSYRGSKSVDFGHSLLHVRSGVSRTGLPVFG